MLPRPAEVEVEDQETPIHSVSLIVSVRRKRFLPSLVRRGHRDSGQQQPQALSSDDRMEMSYSELGSSGGFTQVLNEEALIGGMVRQLRSLSPAAAEVIVIDSGSTDATAARARAAGARVRHTALP